jgi:hypothetical protein
VVVVVFVGGKDFMLCVGVLAGWLVPFHVVVGFVCTTHVGHGCGQWSVHKFWVWIKKASIEANFKLPISPFHKI